MLQYFSNLSQFQGIKHFISTREGGGSTNEVAGLNLGYRTSDTSEQVLANRQILAQKIDIPLANFCFLQQTHSAQVGLVTEKDRGRGAFEYMSGLPATDALITQAKDICLTVLSADCTLLILYDAEHEAIGAVHSGWRGTVQKLAWRTLEAMQASFGTNPAQVWVGIAPCISASVYEVGEDVIQATQNAFGTLEKYLAYHAPTGRWHFDLRYSNVQMLKEAGVPISQIEVSAECTYLNPHLYYSARLTEGKTGRFGAGVMLIA